MLSRYIDVSSIIKPIHLLEQLFPLIVSYIQTPTIDYQVYQLPKDLHNTTQLNVTAVLTVANSTAL